MKRSVFYLLISSLLSLLAVLSLESLVVHYCIKLLLELNTISTIIMLMEFSFDKSDFEVLNRVSISVVRTFERMNFQRSSKKGANNSAEEAFINSIDSSEY